MLLHKIQYNWIEDMHLFALIIVASIDILLDQSRLSPLGHLDNNVVHKRFHYIQVDKYKFLVSDHIAPLRNIRAVYRTVQF